MTIDQKALELLPCPFCGGEATYYHRDEPNGWSNTDWVCCANDDCGCGTCLHGTKENAIAAWNRRALPAPDHAGLVEKEIRTLLCSFVAEHFPENNGWKPLPDLLGMISQLDNAITIARDYRAKLEAATALSAGVRVKITEKARTAFYEATEITREGSVRNLDAGLTAAISALSDAPVVTEDREAQLMGALEQAALALDESAIEVQSWGAYASEYFQDKHDLEGCCDTISKAAARARDAALGGGE